MKHADVFHPRHEIFIFPQISTAVVVTYFCSPVFWSCTPFESAKVPSGKKLRASSLLWLASLQAPFWALVGLVPGR